MTFDAENDTPSLPAALVRFFQAPIRLRTYSNLLFLALAFPTGLVYFVFLAVGLPLGYGLTVIWIGFPILALVFAGSWWMSALERRMAIGLLGAEVPPMAGAPKVEALGFWQRLRTFLANPVTWKGMGYLLMKLPLGVVTFVALVTSVSISVGLLLTPVFWALGDLSSDVYVDDVVLQPATFGGALAWGLVGAVLLLVTLNLMNALAFVWRELATAMLGSSRHAMAAPPPPEATGLTPGTSGMPAPAAA